MIRPTPGPRHLVLCLGLVATAFAGTALAADLVVDGTTTTLGGTLDYDSVQVINGGVLYVSSYDGDPSSTGTLHLIADSIEVDGTSQIVATGRGYRGQTNANGEGPGGGQGGACCQDAGGGGGHGGAGGDASRDGCGGNDGDGGSAYGDAYTLDVDMGSAGGAAGAADGDGGGYGGYGGGAVILEAPSIEIAGSITASGNSGSVFNNDAAGGGAGGGILLIADTLTCSGTLTANGGGGAVVDDGGGGGGGGVVKQFYDSPSGLCTVSVSGGSAGCGAETGSAGISGSGAVDWDGDGYTYDDGDCDPQDGDIYPGADELCDGVDNDCDGTVDEGDAIDAAQWYEDADGDGYGNAAVSQAACDQPTGYVDNLDDCDDGDADQFPGADEYCNGEDDDCDGVIDEDEALDVLTWYLDDDGDGYGDPLFDDVDCDQPSGYVDNDDDCDDGDDDQFPGADEYCNGEDDDCDGTVDEDDAIDVLTWYLDDDGDGYGDAAVDDIDCDQPTGYVDNDDDCDDGDGDQYPGADELCNGEDDDCDGVVDEDDAIDVLTWYLDGDGDGYGDPAVDDVDCDQPTGYVDNDDDCDDGDADQFPGADEYCNGEDDDCDGTVDEDDAIDVLTWYLDDDGDGYGDPDADDIDCDQPGGYVANATDCDDGDAAQFPGADEVCNGEDDDCDGAVDEDDALDALTWYLDLDGDGYGNAAVTYVTCYQPDGYVLDDTDCDDVDPAQFPGADEVCNGEDDDCDGVVDEDDAVDAQTWYRDADGDGYGNAAVSDVDCYQPGGYVADATDCDDSNSQIHPAMVELCNDVDDDCDGDVDEQLATQDWYPDADGDGFGDAGATPVVDCAVQPGHVLNDGDCDDGDPAQFPGADEYCNGEDDDCDGTVDEDDAVDAITWYQDADGDGFGDPAVTDVECSQPDGFVAAATDCDDADAAQFPGADEVCNGEDDDCDGTVDEPDALDALTWYADVDGDGFGDPAADQLACDAPADHVLDDTDCDDGDPLVNPAAAELCNGIDDDCDGDVDEDDADDSLTWYQDADGDGYGDPATATEACYAPDGHVGDASDCNDGDAAVNPSATEVCDGIDNDCDGAVDEDDAIDALTWYEDTDGDGYGDPQSPTLACDTPDGFVDNADDCDDQDGAVFPGADEWCNGVDDDCDGLIDEEDAVDAETWYPDADGDGYGDPDNPVQACYPPAGHVADGSDCADNAPAVNPGAEEICNGVDDDCDPLTDEGADVDGDGYSVCDGDCDDDDGGVNPDADEICDGIDNDCDPGTDEDADEDGDGVSICDGDCDDDDAGVYPGAAEICDGVDNDCDGDLLVDEVDDDGDDWLVCDGDCDDDDPLTWPGAPEQCDQLDNDCDGDVDEDVEIDLDGDGVNACQGDCDNNDPNVHPGAVEICDGKDDDCDGVIPADEVDEDDDGYALCDGDCDDTDPDLELDDGDGDGWTTCDGDCDDDDASLDPADLDGDTYSTCEDDCDDDDAFLTPEDSDLDGYSTCDGDCDDDDVDAYPGHDEVPYDGVDQDCDGSDLSDVDGDGYDGGTAGDDCDDEDPDVNPAADEVCEDGVDNDCDGLTDGDDEECDPAGDDDDTTGDDDDDTTDPADDDTTEEGTDCTCRQAPRRSASPTALAVLALFAWISARRRRP